MDSGSHAPGNRFTAAQDREIHFACRRSMRITPLQAADGESD